MCILTASAIEVKSHQRVMITVSKEENKNLDIFLLFWESARKSGALQISENDLSKCSIHLNFDLLLMLELNKKSTMQCVF